MWLWGAGIWIEGFVSGTFSSICCASASVNHFIGTKIRSHTHIMETKSQLTIPFLVFTLWHRESKQCPPKWLKCMCVSGTNCARLRDWLAWLALALAPSLLLCLSFCHLSSWCYFQPSPPSLRPLLSVLIFLLFTLSLPHLHPSLVIRPFSFHTCFLQQADCDLFKAHGE